MPESFRVTLLEKGEVGSGDAIFVPANAKNVASALLLIDMAMSKEFQLWKLENKASRSPRADVTNDLMPKAVQEHVLPQSVYPRLSVPAFWDMSTALAEALDEKCSTSNTCPDRPDRGAGNRQTVREPWSQP